MELLNELPTWAKFLVVYGPLGVWAAVSTFALVKVHNAFHNARTTHETSLAEVNKDHSKALLDQAEAHAARIEETHKVHAEKLEAQAELHHEQMAELTTRFVGLNQEAFAQARSATEQATALVDAVKRVLVRDGTPR